MLCALACLFAFASPPLFPATQLSAPLSLPDGSDRALATVSHRTLSALPDGDGSQLLLDSDVEEEDWAAAVAAIRASLPAAEFVCTRTACVSLQDSSAAPPAPVHIGASDDSSDTVMLATLRDLAPAAIALREPLGTASAAAPAVDAPLRGVGQMVPRAVSRPPPRLCASAGCSQGFEALADDAMNSAGLVAPGSCRLVYDSSSVPTEDAESGTPARAWAAGRAAAAATEQRGAHGFVLLNDGSRVLARRSHDAFDDAGAAEGASAGVGGPRRDEGGPDEAPVVSVMLPIDRSMAADAQVLTPLNHLYVVMVHPARRFQAFECDLPHALYA